jgi:endonuclease/exonuclease/phosphatase family metal-dependent hydrolase
MEHESVEPLTDRAVEREVPTTGKSVTAITYNTGLAPVLLYKRERMDPIIEEISKKDADVICLQEVWMKSDKDKFKRELEDKFPYSFHSTPGSDRYGGCTIPEFFSFIQCVLSDPEGQAKCLQKSVPADGSTDAEISTQCVECFLAQYLETNGYVKSIAQCPFGELGTALKLAKLDAYDGDNGLMIFSKHEFAQTWRVDLSGYFVRRGMLMARIGDLTVGCTHFATETVVPYAGDKGAAGDKTAYDEENRLNFVETTEFMNNHQKGPRILLGDFNSGPAVAADDATNQPEIDPYLPDNYGVAISAGFVKATPVPALCTWCYPTEEKPFYDTPKGSIIMDHILYKGFAAAPSVKEVFRKTIKVEKPFEDEAETPLSDHEAGIEATFVMP